MRITGWLAAAALGACMPYPLATPADELGQARSAVHEAEHMNASASPRAGQHLGRAEQELEIAQSLIDAGRMPEARRMLMRAKADAELASAETRLERTDMEAERIENERQMIDNSIRRTSGPVDGGR